MPHPDINVRCPSCRGVAAIDADSNGEPVACPFCDFIFTAYPDAAVLQSARPARSIPNVSVTQDPGVWSSETNSDPLESSNSIPFLVGLALLPLGVPILWVIALSMGKWEPLFTASVPIAVGIGAAGLGIGASLTKNWSPSRKLKSILAISLMAFGSGGCLFLLKKEWAEAVRKRFGADEFNWQIHDAGPFTVKVPPKIAKQKDIEPLLPEWKLYSVRYGNSKQAVLDSYRIAHGAEPPALVGLNGDAWFDAAVKEMTTDETGTLIRTVPISIQGFRGVESTFRKVDGATNLSVRLFRVGQAVILISVEGPLLPADARDVQTFFRSLYIKPVKR